MMHDFINYGLLLTTLLLSITHRHDVLAVDSRKGVWAALPPASSNRSQYQFVQVEESQTSPWQQEQPLPRQLVKVSNNRKRSLGRDPNWRQRSRLRYSRFRFGKRELNALNWHPHNCPDRCVCLGTSVECVRGQLRSIPHQLPRHTERLVITGNQLRQITADSFPELPNLKVLILSENNIDYIERGAFRKMSRLRRIDLKNNNLTCPVAGTFDGLKELRHISLSNNKIVWLPENLLDNQRELQNFQLYGNPLLCNCHLRPLIQRLLTNHQLHLLINSGASCSGGSQFWGTQSRYLNHRRRSLTPSGINIRSIHYLDCPAAPLVPPACLARKASSCQSVCDCSMPGIVNCKQRGLTEVPSDLPEDTVELNLVNNLIENLTAESLQPYKKLTKLIIDNNRLSRIDADAFNSLKHLSSLYMSSNQLTSLSPNVFSGLVNLKILYLHRNSIKCLSSKIFDGLNNLQILHLSNNKLRTLHESTFNGLDGLKYLYLVNNPLACDCRLGWLSRYLIEKEAGGMEWTRCASPNAFSGRIVRELKPEEFHCNDINDMSPINMLFPIPHKGLNRNSRQVFGSGDDIDNDECDPPNRIIGINDYCPTQCSCFELPNSRLDWLDQKTRGEKALRVDCSDRGLQAIPVQLPPNTVELNLNGNSINELTGFNNNGLAKVPYLSTLILSNNSLTSLNDSSLLGLNRLEIVMLNNNKLKCIQKGTFDGLQLDSLSLSSNPLNCNCHLSWLPDWLRAHAHEAIRGPPLAPACLQPEQLAGTPVSSLSRYHFTCNNQANCKQHNSARDCKSPTGDLEGCCSQGRNSVPSSASNQSCPKQCACKADSVYCSDKQLTAIPDDIPSETTQLYLERNQIKRIEPEKLAHLSKLHTLVLSNNQIRELQSEAFVDLTSLKTLVLSHNRIRCVHRTAFVGLSGLRVLILQSNNISSIPYGTFTNLVNLNNIALGQNPWHCDCNLKWLNSFFRQQFLDNGVALCSSPSSMQYKSIYHSKPSQFVCPGQINRFRRDLSNTSSLLIGLHNLVSNSKWLDRHSTSSLVSSDYQHIDWSELEGKLDQDELDTLKVQAKCSPCLLNPCQNNGKCRPEGQLTFNCTCASGYTGVTCDRLSNPCEASNPCQNNGQCEPLLTAQGFKCNCLSGFYGSTCADRVEHCLIDKCVNGGRCERIGAKDRCHCQLGFTGEKCENELMYCREFNPCTNGGICHREENNQYRCECPPGWSGKNCHINNNDCLFNRCENGATCVDGISEYVCKCRPGYAGMYCERSTWNPDVRVTRMDKLPTLRTAGVRHSPIKTRSLSVPDLQRQCAYHQCQNKASCIESDHDAYKCNCRPGFDGQYCEQLHSINLPSSHSYVAIVPPSRGAMVPSGDIAFEFSTHQSNGMILYYVDTVQSEEDEKPRQFLLVGLDQGQLRAMFSLDGFRVHERRSSRSINDDKFHLIELKVIGENISLQVDGISQLQLSIHHDQQPEKQISKKRYRRHDQQTVNEELDVEESDETGEDEALKHLALTNPLYFGGAPIDRLKTAGKILRAKQAYGFTGCLRQVRINSRLIDFSRLFGAPVDKLTDDIGSQSPEAKHYGTAIGIMPGCVERSFEVDSQQDSSSAGVKWQDQWMPWSNPVEYNDPCARRDLCQNGGRCTSLQSDKHQEDDYKCSCPRGFQGRHCEIANRCRWTTENFYMKDTQTGCMSVNKLALRNCLGSCDDAEPNGSTFKPLHKRQHLLSQQLISGQSESSSCCQPTRYKYRLVQFRCTNGWRYKRKLKLVRQCGCQACTSSRTLAN